MSQYEQQDQAQNQPLFDPQRNVWEEAANDDLPREDGYFYAPYMPEEAEEEYAGDQEDPMVRKLRRRGRFQLLAGLTDFMLVIVGVAAILVLIALIVSLITWLRSDLDQSFTLLVNAF